MKTVITYGTYDLFHHGHLKLLRRAKELGDKLIVGISTDEFNEREKSKTAVHSYEKRKAIVASVAFVDQVIPEATWEQKREDVKRLAVDVFVMGDDWAGHFDELGERGCEVVYLPRTPLVSASHIRATIQPERAITGLQPISCVVTNYNGAAFLDQALQSLLNQRLPPTEILIADDASTDGSRNLIETYAQTHDSIRPVFRDRRIGVSQNRDMAIRATTHDWVTTLDSDDWFHTEKLAAEARALAAHPGAVACSDTALYDIDRQCFDIIHTAPLCAMSPPQRLMAIAARDKLIPRDLLMSHETYEQAGGLSPGLKTYEDWAFKMSLADQDVPFVHSGVIGTAYYRRGSGLSGGGHLPHLEGKLLALKSVSRSLHYPFAFWTGVLKLFFYKGPRKLRHWSRPEHEIL